MSDRIDHQFVGTDTEGLLQLAIAVYEQLTGITVRPASPEHLFIRWVADMLLQTRVLINHAANQNLPSRATGENLDALGELFYSHDRPEAAAATCWLQVTISAAQDTAILIPKGTRFTDISNTLYWDAMEDAYIQPGELTGSVQIVCETAGTVGNGYLPGQINTLVDISDILYYSSCRNFTVSDGGAEKASDEEFYQLLRASEDAYSVAGPMGAYEYWAKSVSTEIADIKAIRPTEIRSRTLRVYDGHAFMGGEHFYLSTLRVFLPDGSVAASGTDYTATYEDDLLTIAISPSGTLAGATMLQVEIIADMEGHVHIYALMEDGSIASETIKDMIAEACTDEKVRPLTDYVEVRDPGSITYNIDVTYYIQRNVKKSASDIQAAVNNAVQKYIAWQAGKLGRDINPSKLHDLMMEASIKRVEIAEPAFTKLSEGLDGRAPEIACVGAVTIRNGGYEDE